MASGGARARSGPARDLDSARSESRGVQVRILPVEGFRGEVPEFPLRDNPDFDAADRERELWAWAWRTPQAFAWNGEPWRWYSVALWVRTAVVCEDPAARTADKTTLLRLAEDIGLSQAGLDRNGWVVKVVDSPVETSASKPERVSSRDRAKFKVVNGGKR